MPHRPVSPRRRRRRRRRRGDSRRCPTRASRSCGRRRGPRCAGGTRMGTAWQCPCRRSSQTIGPSLTSMRPAILPSSRRAVEPHAGHAGRDRLGIGHQRPDGLARVLQNEGLGEANDAPSTILDAAGGDADRLRGRPRLRRSSEAARDAGPRPSAASRALRGLGNRAPALAQARRGWPSQPDVEWCRTRTGSDTSPPSRARSRRRSPCSRCSGTGCRSSRGGFRRRESPPFRRTRSRAATSMPGVQ